MKQLVFFRGGGLEKCQSAKNFRSVIIYFFYNSAFRRPFTHLCYKKKKNDNNSF